MQRGRKRCHAQRTAVSPSNHENFFCQLKRNFVNRVYFVDNSCSFRDNFCKAAQSGGARRRGISGAGGGQGENFHTYTICRQRCPQKNIRLSTPDFPPKGLLFGGFLFIIMLKEGSAQALSTFAHPLLLYLLYKINNFKNIFAPAGREEQFFGRKA